MELVMMRRIAAFGLAVVITGLSFGVSVSSGEIGVAPAKADAVCGDNGYSCGTSASNFICCNNSQACCTSSGGSLYCGGSNGCDRG